jgi:hypothetical protein
VVTTLAGKGRGHSIAAEMRSKVGIMTKLAEFLRAAVFASPLIVATASSAQTVQAPPPPKPLETVTVTGQRQAEDQLKAVIAQFVEQHSARDRKSGLLVRDAPSGICPLTLGLPAAYNDFVTARIVSVAKSVGAGVQDIATCRANVEILFTDEPQTVVNSLAEKTKGMILGLHYVHERRDLMRVWRPIQAWYVTGTRNDPNALGSTVARDGSVKGNSGHLAVDQAYGAGPYTGTGSHIRSRNSSEIMNTLILADTGKIAGHEIGPISDYIAMLALAQAQSLDDCNEMPSILDLMSSGCLTREKPQSLTPSDMAYLKALYASDITTSTNTASDNIVNGMSTTLTEPKP